MSFHVMSELGKMIFDLTGHYFRCFFALIHRREVKIEEQRREENNDDFPISEVPAVMIPITPLDFFKAFL